MSGDDYWWITLCHYCNGEKSILVPWNYYSSSFHNKSKKVSKYSLYKSSKVSALLYEVKSWPITTRKLFWRRLMILLSITTADISEFWSMSRARYKRTEPSSFNYNVVGFDEIFLSSLVANNLALTVFITLHTPPTRGKISKFRFI